MFHEIKHIIETTQDPSAVLVALQTLLQDKADGALVMPTPTDTNWLSLIIHIYERQLAQASHNDTQAAKAALATLSYSELSSALFILKEITDIKTIVIGHIAKESGFSRAIIGNAISKLASAGILEARSLGVKGMHLKIINKKIIEEIHKLR